MKLGNLLEFYFEHSHNIRKLFSTYTLIFQQLWTNKQTRQNNRIWNCVCLKQYLIIAADWLISKLSNLFYCLFCQVLFWYSVRLPDDWYVCCRLLVVYSLLMVVMGGTTGQYLQTANASSLSSSSSLPVRSRFPRANSLTDNPWKKIYM